MEMGGIGVRKSLAIAIRRWRRDRVKKRYRSLFNEVSMILFQHDPIGINFETNADEYEPEVGTILPRLRRCRSARDVRAMIPQEFCRWFGTDIAGPPERYETVATEIWRVWLLHQRIREGL